MEMDRYSDGRLPFADYSSLKTTDGTTTQRIAGQATNYGYTEWKGLAARFQEITGYYQVNSRSVLVVEFWNHCLRLVEHLTGQPQAYSGRCTKSGYIDDDGSEALFSFPTCIIADNQNHENLIITDRNNKAVRHVNIKTGSHIYILQIQPENIPVWDY